MATNGASRALLRFESRFVSERGNEILKTVSRWNRISILNWFDAVLLGLTFEIFRNVKEIFISFRGRNEALEQKQKI